ncbi:lipopolysaccharide biosynthesis protein [Rhizobium sp. 18055]|uniref:lipopolysaccharide biosynthesis protein n=1 Tax=Rhizobium sp. 18055 TaxID=2681403 RepID=UPI001359D81E|nr:hypothetical protein [Rhizobium sp. 18055]
MKPTPLPASRFQRILAAGFATRTILFARLLQNANGFLLTTIVAGRYGLDAVGTLTLATIPITLVTLFGTFGLHFRFAQIDANHSILNTLGLISAVVSLPIILGVSLAFAFIFGHSQHEQFQLAVIALSSPFFAQCNVMNALQVLQNRQVHSIISPGMNMLGLGLGAFSQDFSTFCVWVLVFRVLGIVIPYALLPHDFSNLRQTAKQLGSGLRFLFSDAVLILSDNLILLLSAHVLTRADLGILGICRQLLTASDTPGWANMQSSYPRLVAEGDRYFHQLTQVMFRTGAFLGVVVTALAFLAGALVFHVQNLWFYTAILMVSAPARYVVLTIETQLKAKGAISVANWLTGLRAIAGFVVIGTATVLNGLLGHIVALAGFFVVLALVESLLSKRKKQGRSAIVMTGKRL